MLCCYELYVSGAQSARMEQRASNVSLITPVAGLFDSWYALYEAYAQERGTHVDRRNGGQMWRWLLDGTYRIAGVLAIDGRKDVVGFAHYRPFPRTLHGDEACYLDDLYVAERLRDSDLAEDLLVHVSSIARKRGWREVRCMSSAANAQTHGLYARTASPLEVTTYRIALDP
ncbi:MAG: hypothetical protein NVS2B17_03990 [Candidatus Velthaea sp.]